MKTKIINISELDDYFKLCQLEQTFRVKLNNYKEGQELQLKRVKELKVIAEQLTIFKGSLRYKMFVDKELQKEINKILNRRFKGGINGI